MAEEGFVKINPLTQLMDRITEINRTGGVDTPIEIGMGPSVRSASLGKEVPDYIPEPLSDEELAERNARAQELGLIERDELDELADDTVYVETPQPILPRGRRPLPVNRIMPVAPRLPDFTKIEGYDLRNNTVIVDGFALPLPDEDVSDLKSRAIELALDYVVKQIATAYQGLGMSAETLRESIIGATNIEPAQSLSTEREGNSERTQGEGTVKTGFGSMGEEISE